MTMDAVANQPPEDPTIGPHPFSGRSDRWCEVPGCNRPDRNLIHVEQEPSRLYHQEIARRIRLICVSLSRATDRDVANWEKDGDLVAWRARSGVVLVCLDRVAPRTSLVTVKLATGQQFSTNDGMVAAGLINAIRAQVERRDVAQAGPQFDKLLHDVEMLDVDGVTETVEIRG